MSMNPRTVPIGPDIDFDQDWDVRSRTSSRRGSDGVGFFDGGWDDPPRHASQSSQSSGSQRPPSDADGDRANSATGSSLPSPRTGLERQARQSGQSSRSSPRPSSDMNA